MSVVPEVFYEKVTDLAADLPANTLFVQQIVQDALKSCLASKLSEAGGIFLEIPVQAGGEYGTEAENFLVVECAEAVPSGEGGFSRSIATSVGFYTNRSLSYANAGKLFSCLLAYLQPGNLSADLAAALAVSSPRLKIARIGDAGESQTVDDEGRNMTKNLVIVVGATV
jgi:hypothetical protein